jgi:hypothetical protein
MMVRRPQVLAAMLKMMIPIKKPIKNASKMGDGLTFPDNSRPSCSMIRESFSVHYPIFKA